ncbi:MAG: glycerol kinase GlpK [Alphaproteobacteria bacterium]|nr:glycerol kinase GlpK [Alphaproteobacteria bacterium]
MARPNHILAIDQGTTSTRAMVFDTAGRTVAAAQEELPQIYPRPGWVEHDPEALWRGVLATASAALAQAASQGLEIAAAGITNQRETTIIWDRETGAPIHNAIVWQDRRTASMCRQLRDAGHEQLVRARTGLVLDPYFSATKIAWILDTVDGARAKAEAGALAFGTVDSFLLWRLTGGAVHATDATNASRTALFNIHDQAWDPDLMDLFGVPAAILPRVEDNAAAFGTIDPAHFGRGIPVTGMAGDQQAAMIGQACFASGSIKATFGTGCFVVLNTGDRPVVSQNGLLTTLAYRLGGAPTYALEGSVFVAGAALQWLRDELNLFADASASEAMAAGLEDNGGVYFVPAFTGLGAPHWDPEARGAILGLTRDTGPATIVRAALEAVAYQTHDLVSAMAADFGPEAGDLVLRVDGGMVANDWLMQFLADILDLAVDRPSVHETTAAGVAYLAGLGAGLYRSLDDIEACWQRDRRLEPAMDRQARAALLDGWRDALARVVNTS